MERETMEFDCLIVGGGPAGLAAALHLARLAKQNAASVGELQIAVLEKAAQIGAHTVSGAILDPIALAELVPDYKAKGAPLAAEVKDDHLEFLTAGAALVAPITPPPLMNHGCSIIALSDFVQWMAKECEAAGVNIFTGFAGSELLMDGRKVAGVRTGDKGIDKNGERKANFEPGLDLKAKVTIVGEGARGSLTKVLLDKLGMHGRFPQVYATGVKEIWKLKPGRATPGSVVHTMGYPLDFQTFGGGFIYTMPDDILSLGFVVGLDYRDPTTDPHRKFQEYKQHPRVRALLEGGELVSYAAKTIAEGGWYAMPKLFTDGCMLVGESAGFLNSQRLKGIHLSMKSGMMAAETALEALQKKDASASVLSGYERRFKESWAAAELFKVRNFRQSFEHGLLIGMIHTGLQMISGGRGLIDPMPIRAGHEHMRRLTNGQRAAALAAAPAPAALLPAAATGEPAPAPMASAASTAAAGGATPSSAIAGAGPAASPGPASPGGAAAPGPAGATPAARFDGKLTFDKLTDVFASGTRHDENQRCHLRVADTSVCHTRCVEEYGNPCQHFCPASVYEMVADTAQPRGKRLVINFTNCVHCKTCDIADPYQIITWVTPEGGGGPMYKRT